MLTLIGKRNNFKVESLEKKNLEIIKKKKRSGVIVQAELMFYLRRRVYGSFAMC